MPFKAADMIAHPLKELEVVKENEALAALAATVTDAGRARPVLVDFRVTV